MREKLEHSHWAIRLVAFPVVICSGLWCFVHFGFKPLLAFILPAIGLQGRFSMITAIYIALGIALALALCGFYGLNQGINNARIAKNAEINS